MVRRLTERIAETTDPTGVLESITADRLGRAQPGGPDGPSDRGPVAGRRPVAAVAAEIGLSSRQLHRRSLAACGYGPKTLALVLRVDGALRLTRTGTPFATVAATAGYTDEAHLAHDVRALAGVPLRALLTS